MTVFTMRLTLWILVFLFACQPDSLCFQYTRELSKAFPYTIQESKKLTLHLAERTVHPWIYGSYFQYIPEGNHLAYLNKQGSNIQVFDLSTGEIIQTVPLFKYGPNNIGNEPVGFYWLNQDSIFISSDLNNGRLSLINAEGIKLKNYELQEVNDRHFVEISEVAGGMLYHQGFLYLGLRVADFNQMPNRSGLLTLNVNTGEVSYPKHPLPVEESDLDRIPLDQRYSSVNIDMNRDKNELVLSFPLSNHLLIKNGGSYWLKKEAKSDYFNELTFLKRPSDYYGHATQDYMEEMRFMPRYTGVFYDSYRKVYYRIGRLNYNKELDQQRKAGVKIKIYQEFSIQVFDSTLQKIAENKFFTNGLLYEQGVFINEEGLWLLCPQEGDEDVMDFRLMELSRTN